MNHQEHTMPTSGRTRDRMTVNPGWAGTHYRRPRALVGNLMVLALFACIGLLLAYRG